MNAVKVVSVSVPSSDPVSMTKGEANAHALLKARIIADVKAHAPVPAYVRVACALVALFHSAK